MIKILEKYPILSLTIIVLSMLLINLSVPNITIMEARNFITAREMINDGHWILTTLNGEPRYEKPPLPTWLTAFSAIVFGIKSLTALRFPAAIMVLFLGIYSYLFSLELNLPKKHSFRNSLIVITSFYIIGIVNEAPWDIFAHGFMLASIYYLVKFLKSAKTNWQGIIAGGIFFGFSILSKGPISIYALFLPFMLAFFSNYNIKYLKKKALPIIIFLIISISIGSSWFLFIKINDPAVLTSIVEKETENWSNYNVKPFYYYWSFFIQSGIWTILAFVGLLYPYLKKRIKHQNSYKFIILWTLLSVILLSIIPEKKARYLMPVLIPLAFNTGFYVDYLINNFKYFNNWMEKSPIYLNFGIIGIASLFSPFLLYFLLSNEFELYMWNYIITSIILILLGIAIIHALYIKAIKKSFYLVVSFVVTLLIFALPFTKVFNTNENYSPINKLHSIENKLKITTYSFGEITPEFIWDYDGKIKNIYTNEILNFPIEEEFGILLSKADLEQVKDLFGQEYQLKYIDTYNQNVGSKIKQRLIRQFYVVSKN